jgi:SAM-dependent methyltransferase
MMESSARHAAVHATNLPQAQSWDGPDGAFWAASADRFDRAVAGYQERFEAAAAVRRGDRVLDIGCGAGLTTCRAADASIDGEALGVDLSASLLEVARRRAEAEGLGNARFVQADAQVHAFERQYYDLVMSRTGAMFFGDPAAAFDNLRAATRPGGRLVLLTWQAPERSEWISGTLGVLGGSPGSGTAAPDPTAPGPFSLSDPERIHRLLSATGWTPLRVDGVEAREWFGTDVDDALQFLTGLFAWRLEPMAPEERAAAVERLRHSLATHAGPNGVEFGSAAWLVTARR